MGAFSIRNAEISDAPRLVEIYAYYVEKTAISFEYEVPSVEEFENRIRKVTKKYPYLVCEDDGRIVGYCYAGTYSTREAYDWTVVTSIYVDKDYRRQGIGSMMYEALEEELKKRGIVNLLAGVAACDVEDEYLTNASNSFHIKSGYEKVALMKKIGKKFDRWYDLIWFQKRIGD